MKCRIDKAVRVLENYDLFVIENTTFYSTDLIEKMQPLEKKRAQKRTTQSNESVSQNEQTLSEKSISLSANEESLLKASCNSLEIKDDSSLSKVKESKVKYHHHQKKMMWLLLFLFPWLGSVMWMNWRKSKAG